MFSEDCLPPDGHIEGIGASLPEFEVLGYPENKMAYYIRCPKCVDIFAKPKDKYEQVWGREWLKEIHDAKKEVEAREMAEEEEMDVDEQVAKLTLPEAIDLTKSESQSTATTDPEEYTEHPVFGSYFVGRREIIVID
jgi:hypothetical protein